MLLNLIVVHLLECKWTIFCKKGTTHKESIFVGEARRWYRFTYDKCFER